MCSIVVKIGSSSVTRATGPDPVLLTSALDAAIGARSIGWSVVLISSGAVSSGSAYLSRTLQIRPSKRLAAAVGQPFLMDIYRSVSEVSGSHVCQILISESDLRSPTAMAALASVLDECATAGVVPILNGNDVTDMLGSDNDAVAAGIAVAGGADKLLLLTDVAGVYRGYPEDSDLLPDLSAESLGNVSISNTGTGRGGMGSKLRAAQLAAYNGIETHIADARTPDVITRCITGERTGTRISAVRPRFAACDRWIAGIAVSHGTLVINRQAEESVRAGSSLFASGIKKVHGSFKAGDVVSVVSPAGKLIARGACRVSAALLTLVRAMQTQEIALVLTEVLWQFHAGDSPDQARGGSKHSTSEIQTRPQVDRALALIRSQGYERTRQLALEIINLFPTATAGAMFGSKTSDRIESDGIGYLREQYGKLSSDLSFVDRKQLVVF